MNSYSAPIFSREQLFQFVESQRKTSLPIILANGCFDLIHAGHVRYLEGAKALGGTLLVAVNSDRQVLQLKRKGRPVTSETERWEVIAALRCVDPVTIFDKPTVEAIIRL